MTDEIILCACGCGQPVEKAKYPSQQRRFINTHQHRGTHNGNYKGGLITKCCPVCMKSFAIPAAHKDRRVTCGNDACNREWQRWKTTARGIHKTITKCSYCGKELRVFPSQMHERNYCNRTCQAANTPKNGINNGNWRGGNRNYAREQANIRDEYRCRFCDFNLTVDVHHIVPRSEGGTDEPSNLITLCPNHHRMADLGLIDQMSLILRLP